MAGVVASRLEQRALLVRWLVAALFACGTTDAGSELGGAAGARERDLDGDGWYEPEDCDDGDPTIHPGASEWCNDVDDDCDGAIDEAATDATPWYTDADGDGWGLDALGSACSNPATAVTTAGDCDDADPASFPGAEERCDGADNDCDGETDEALAEATWYEDADGDGHGDPASARSACAAGEDEVADGTDCDDLDREVSPSAKEVCDNHRDDDCDADAADCRLGGTAVIDSAATVLSGGTLGGGAGWAVAGGSDLTGDGVLDFLVGAPEESKGKDRNGAAYLVSGAPTSGSLLGAQAAFLGATGEDWAGWSLASAADVDGDGTDDILVGAYRVAERGYNAGAAYLLGGGSWAGEYDIGESAAARLLGGEGNDNFAYAVASTGDGDGDGYGDLVVGAVQESTAAEEAGAVYLYRGPLLGDVLPAAAAATWRGEAAYDYAGFSLAAGRDVDGDGVPEVVVGTYSESSAGPTYGAAYVVTTGATGEQSLATADAKLLGFTEGGRAGYSVGLVDDNGDGYADVLVGAPFDGSAGGLAGAVCVARGPVSGTWSLAGADACVFGASSGDQLGFSVAGVGDFDADGREDVALGAPCDATGGDCAGATYVVHGNLAGTASVDDVGARLHGAAGMFAVGWAVAGAGDIDTDGYDDLVTGGPGALFGPDAEQLGAAYVVLGRGP